MVVGQYIEIKSNRSWKTRCCYKFKDCFSFLERYFKDGCPYTMNGVGYNTKSHLHCNSGKSRTYHDLLCLANNHVNPENFSIKKFNKAFRQFLFNKKLAITYCPWIEDIVFKYKDKGTVENYYKIIDNDIILINYSAFKLDKSVKSKIMKDVLLKTLKLKM